MRPGTCVALASTSGTVLVTIKVPNLRSESLGNALAAKVQSLAEPAGAKVRASTLPAALRFGLACVGPPESRAESVASATAPLNLTITITIPITITIAITLTIYITISIALFACAHKDVNNSKKVVPRSSRPKTLGFRKVRP